jgi:hypothetical protein
MISAGKDLFNPDRRRKQIFFSLETLTFKTQTKDID